MHRVLRIRIGLASGAAAVAAFARVPPAPARQDPNIRDVPDGNLTVVRVQADGNCFFRALAQSHTFNQELRILDRLEEGQRADELRARIVGALNESRDFLEPFMTIPWDKYCSTMAQTGTWAGEPELAVAPHVLKAPVHVYTPGRPFKRLTAYGDTYGESAPPVCVLFYGQHYDALVDLDKKPGAARSRGPSSRKRSRDPPSDHLSGQNF